MISREELEDCDDIDEYIKEVNEGQKTLYIATLLSLKKLIETHDDKQVVIDAINTMVNSIKRSKEKE